MVFLTPFSRENQQPGFSISGTLTRIIQSVHETPKAMIIETYPKSITLSKKKFKYSHFTFRNLQIRPISQHI